MERSVGYIRAICHNKVTRMCANYFALNERQSFDGGTWASCFAGLGAKLAAR